MDKLLGLLNAESSQLWVRLREVLGNVVDRFRVADEMDLQGHDENGMFEDTGSL